MRLAARRGGRLTVVEVITELAVSTEAAKESLDALAMQEVADMEVTDSGMLVYAFRDIQNLSQKENAKGILDD
jgi:predicted ArsR family transcriptional regulator